MLLQRNQTCGRGFRSKRAQAVRSDARQPELFLQRAVRRSNELTYPMTLKTWILAGGLLAFAAAGTAIRMARARSKRLTMDQLSGDWLAQARAREEHPS